MYTEDDKYIISSFPLPEEEDIINNSIKKMFTINSADVKSALVSGLLTMVLAMAGYLIGVGDVFAIDVKTLVNVGALSALTAIVSVTKSFLTSNSTGKFAGAVTIK